jgi:aryl-alcohol dehydrogenase-like predicted oxidoreductase
MEKRPIGTSQLQVAPLAFGGNVFGWTIDEATSFSILDAFVDAGLNFIDTADVYSAWVPGHRGGESETIIGKWFARSGKREQVVLATKVAKHPQRPGLSADNIQAAVEDSLRRLQTDYIDIYFSHHDDDAISIEETLYAYQRLINAGKVRVLGASNYRGARIKDALRAAQRHKLSAYQILQPEYNLCERANYEEDIEPVALEHNLAVVPYYSLASGFLSGKYRSPEDLAKSVRGDRVSQYLTRRGMRILAALDAVSARHATTQAAVALAWLIARPGITAPIASATSLQQLESLVVAVTLELEAKDIQALNAASA